MAKNATPTPKSVITTIEQSVNSVGNVISIEVVRKTIHDDCLYDKTTRQTFDLSVIPYDVALSLACQIVTGFRNSTSK